MLDYKVNNTLNELTKNTHFNGVMLVAVDKNVLFEHCFGYADIDGKIQTSLQTQYLIGSVQNNAQLMSQHFMIRKLSVF